mmetsp:Transcript_29865/g.75142  ORF Transcript_29865/g.75142 Transcript_29865/m.75142 type:complete len:330 (-) Transcript_29865:272-1261(-)
MNATILQTTLDQYDRVVLVRRQLVIRGVGIHIVVKFLVVWISPLFVFHHGQRNGWIMHGVDHIDKGHISDHQLEEIGTHVQNRTHGQATSATTKHSQTRCTSVLLLDEVLGNVDAVGEGVLLVQVLAVLVPGATQRSAASHVSDGEAETTIQQRESLAVERGTDRDLVRTVGVQQERRGAVLLEVVFAVDQRDRDLNGFTIAARRGGWNPQAFRTIVVWIKLAATHFLHLANTLREVIHVHVDVGRWTHQRVVLHAEDVAIELEPRRAFHHVGGLLETELLGRLEGERLLLLEEVKDVHLHQTVLTSQHHHVVGVDACVADTSAGVVLQ